MKKSIVLLLSLRHCNDCLVAQREGKAAEEPKTTATQEAPKETPKETPKESEDQKLATAETEEFAFSYPASWQAYDLSQLNQPAIKAAYADPAPKSAFADNVNVAADNSTFTAKENADMVVAQYEGGALANAPSRNFKKSAIPRGPTTAEFWWANIRKAQSGVPVVLTQYIVPTGSSTYTLSISYTKESYENGGKETVQKNGRFLQIKQQSLSCCRYGKTSTGQANAAANAGQTQLTLA
ncbi:hypothetical protein VQ056_05100 [Paenibacillus sp. JTLBN-2024]